MIERLRKISWSTLLTVALVVFLLYRRGPEVLKNFTLESQEFPSSSLQSLSQNQTIFPVKGHSAFVALFWATWCGPCKLEMDRIQKSINENKISADRIFAIHIGGTPVQVQTHMTKYGFTFPALVDSEGHLARALEVNSTPSVFLVSAQGRIVWASSGLGLSDVWRMEQFLAVSPELK